MPHLESYRLRQIKRLWRTLTGITKTFRCYLSSRLKNHNNSCGLKISQWQWMCLMFKPRKLTDVVLNKYINVIWQTEKNAFHKQQHWVKINNIYLTKELWTTDSTLKSYIYIKVTLHSLTFLCAFYITRWGTSVMPLITCHVVPLIDWQVSRPVRWCH